MHKKLKVAVLMGGVSSERNISLATGENVVSALDKKKYEVFAIEVKDKTGWITNLNKKHPGLVFIALHGKFGEDGKVQGILDDLEIPYTGSSALASMLAMDKLITKQIFKAKNILTPSYMVIDQQQYYFEGQEPIKRILSQLKLPLVIKPSASGSSIGVTIIKDKKNIKGALKAAFKEGKQVLIEKYIFGIEITVPVLGNKDPKALPVIEIAPKRDFFDFKAKYNPKLCDEIVPARISKKLTLKAQNLALKVYRAFGCQGFARIDMIAKTSNIPACQRLMPQAMAGRQHPTSNIYVLEINTIPGLTENSLMPKSAKAAGMEFPQLLDKIINCAYEKV